ncbi:hypothetical protein GCM10010112_75560 [Actinoplanes lobatus]|uniref:JmjC domain-containing protein n=1 Tax=Actinoplanes lobatus TaxID=113568 RepID=A0A7W7HHA3_9ACTN|nr:hypothetical protein [Actinoplanes lobatus]MBB4750507.1 hypothetical protein [Actinoplanes lobatus]GGN90293.1 hypothetical protein GCM10010112_75560 [Actinoplanes lobatus]GIE43816.1 hypothetical protein Alo02nite_67140 [Actinoplanes lobatus]
MTSAPATAPADLASFWTAFAADHWERRPLSQETSALRLGLTEDQLFSALLRTAEQVRTGRTSGGLPRFVANIDGRMQPVDTLDFLPRDGERTLDEYLSRLDGRWRDHDWNVAVSGLHAVSAPLWDRAKALADDVYEHTGSRPAGRVDIDTFIGRYASTNVGVHVDHAGNFGFTLRGRKTLLTWPAEAAGQVPQKTLDYSAARDSAEVLVGVPGGLTYFPSPQLHVGESPDDVSVNVNIAFFTRSDVRSRVAAVVDRLLADGAGGAGLAPLPDAPAVPPDAARLLTSVLGSDVARAEDLLWDQWSRSITSSGLDVGRPADQPRAIPAGASVRLRTRAVLRSRRLADGRLAISSQGHVLRVADDPAIEVALRRLDSGAAVDLDGAAPAVLLAVLVRLQSWAALDVTA